MPYVVVADSDIAVNRSLYPEILKRIRDNPGIQASRSDVAAPRVVLDQVTLPPDVDGPALCWADGAGSVLMKAMHSGTPYDLLASNPAWPIPVGAHQLLVECWAGGRNQGIQPHAGGYCIGLFDVTAATAAIVVGGQAQDSSFTLGVQTMFARTGAWLNLGGVIQGPGTPGTGGFLNVTGGPYQAARGGGLYSPGPTSQNYPAPTGSFPGGPGIDGVTLPAAPGLVRVRVIG